MNLLYPIVFLALSVPTFHSAAVAATPWKDGTPRTAIVDLNEWNWSDIAKECVNFLGPKGYRAVKVSPPNEHVNLNQWWARYQPVSYRIQSRSGDREAFRSMVATCKGAGVEIHPDVVINHMANGTGYGTAGSWYDIGSLYYSGVPYDSSDFHPPCVITGDILTHTECWLGRKTGDNGLPDLDTSQIDVQDKIAGFLSDLRSLGVDGFYIDAAKHIALPELKSIMAKVPAPFFVGQETWTDTNVPAYLQKWTEVGILTEFNYARYMRSTFKNEAGRTLSVAHALFSASSRVPSDKALVFVTNHDLERSGCTQIPPVGECGTLTVMRPEYYYSANVLMLGHSYGHPYVYSSYYFADRNDGPTTQPYVGNETVPANCTPTITPGKWGCIHRDWRVANMVGFRNYTHGTAVVNWLADTPNRVSFQRGNKGFVAINNTTTSWQKTFQTGLADGVYCNVVASADPESGHCPLDTRIAVNGGQATVTIAPQSTLALHVGARFVCDNPTDFNFPALREVPPGSTQVSNIVTIGGLSCPAAISITGGEYRINGGAYTRVAGTIQNGQTIQIRLTAPKLENTSASAILRVGTDQAPFTVTTTTPIPCNGQPVCTAPEPLQAGKPVTVYYKGFLQDSASLMLHWGVNGWKGVTDTVMQKSANGYWSVTLPLPTMANEFDFVFTNGGQWDNNNRLDWKMPVTPCSDCPTVSVTFQVVASTIWGESVYMSGNTLELGNDSLTIGQLPKCDPAAYPTWTCTIAFGTPGQTISYRYVKLGLGTKPESGPPRTLTLPPSGAATANDGYFRL